MSFDQDLSRFMSSLAMFESHSNAAIPPNGSGASGKYQFTKGTWQSAGGGKYGDQAFQASESQQDEIARGLMTRYYTKYGNRWDLVAYAWLGGEGTADKEYARPGSQGNVSDANGTSTSGYARTILNNAGLDATGIASPSGATANTPGPVAQQAPAPSYKMPAGGTLTTINGGYAMVVYLVAPGVALAFAATDGVDTSGMPTQDLTSEQWDQYRGGVVLGGDAKTLGGAAKDFPDFQTYWNSMLDMFLGPDAAARADKDVLMVLAKKVERPSMSDEELQNLLKGTQYWKDRTEGQLAWNDKSPAEQAKLVADQMAALTNEYIRLVGVQPSENSLKAMNVWAVKVASGEVGFNQAVNVFVKGDALVDPESPWSRQLRDTEEAGKQRGVDVTNQAETSRLLAAKWGVQLSDDTYTQWGTDIVGKAKSEADYQQYLRDQAQILYPWMKELDPSGTMSTEQLATPWLQTYARVMEKPADLFNPALQKALQSGTPTWQFEQELKSSPDWQHTKNFQDTMTSNLGGLGTRLGFG